MCKVIFMAYRAELKLANGLKTEKQGLNVWYTLESGCQKCKLS